VLERIAAPERGPPLPMSNCNLVRCLRAATSPSSVSRKSVDRSPSLAANGNDPYRVSDSVYQFAAHGLYLGNGGASVPAAARAAR